MTQDRNPRTIQDLNKGFKSWVRDDNENDFLDVYNDFDSRDQSADDDSQGDDEEGSSWVRHTRDDPRESFVTRDDEKVFFDEEEFTVEDSFQFM